MLYASKVSSLDEEGLSFTKKLTAEQVTAYIAWIGPIEPVLAIVHPSTFKAVIRQSDSKPTDYSGVYRLGLSWIGKASVLAAIHSGML